MNQMKLLPLLLALIAAVPAPSLANPELGDIGTSVSECPVVEDTIEEAAIESEPQTLRKVLVEYIIRHRHPSARSYQMHLFHIATLLPQIQSTLAELDRVLNTVDAEGNHIDSYADESAAIGFYYASDFDPAVQLTFIDVQSPRRPMILREYVAATGRAQRVLLRLRREIPGLRRLLGASGREVLAQLSAQIRETLSHTRPVVRGAAFVR